ncbi:helix-turn-helix domain-containing protein [Octadecabacter sp. G9-8]|uniref:Helix-turn-helix domain-containing protein n=1 Tax=Octadecabacter dasysiphoniae TaxID=2909341 RepID=A0ABS9CS74_9RHOB|nr:helix-turn-helix transcriptional regulator [Octadecabacter dasysiphoniae]MCF2869957.1 helix-turn-helix domain-containing protein [Octadecabacter dasysiphoniae]
MSIIIDKRTRATLFRTRLRDAMTVKQATQSGLARAIGVDRSTVSQLLTDEGARLPNAQVVAQCAAQLGVSADWLLGLTDKPELAADLVAAAMEVTKAPRALVDEQIFTWHQEAAGYKIRHVPAGLPDMFKLPEVLQWEYGPSLGRSTDQAIGASEDRLRWMREARSDYEIALPMDELASFAAGSGYYTGVPADLRAAQLDHIATLHDDLYPTLRLHLFDARKLYSAPVTVFGPLLAVIYLGQNYLAFRDTERVQMITKHFDRLVREARITPRDLANYIQTLQTDVL